MADHVIEFLRFRLNDGVDDAAFLATAAPMNARLEARAGFVRRRLSRIDDGTWLEHVEWTDMASAHAASDALMKEDGSGPFLAAIDPASVEMSHSQLRLALG